MFLGSAFFREEREAACDRFPQPGTAEIPASQFCAEFIMGDAPKDGDDSEQDEAKPTKVVFEELTLQVRARCMQLDYEGRSDGRSMHTILMHIAPRHLVLCHGSTQVKILLASLSCHAICMQGQPVLPGVTHSCLVMRLLGGF